MKKIILILFGVLFWIITSAQTEDGEIIAWDLLEAKDAFVIGEHTFYNTTQLDGLDTFLVSLNYLGENFTKNPADSIQINRNAVTTGHNAWKIDPDTINGVLRFYNDEVDIAMQMGQELWIKIKNNNGSTFLNGILIYISGGETGFPVVSIAHNRDFTTVDAIGMITHDVEAGTFGFLTTYGTVGGLDTSGETEGALVYVDTLTAGKNWTTEIPEFANFQYEIGFIHTVDPTDGKIFINPKGQIDDIMHNINNANILENFSFTAASDGATITGTLESTDGKDYLTIRWSDGFAKLAVPTTITIPAGTDNNSQTAYIYIPKSTGVLTSSTSYFPINTQYKTIARTEAWTALRTQAEGLKGIQNYNDFVANISSLRGRIAQIGNWQRLRNLKYINGSAGSITVRPDGGGADTVTFAVAPGNWSQANEQVLDAMDMYTGDIIHVLNYPDHADTTITDLSEVLIDATGSSLANRSWTWVFWISQNKTGEPSHMYVNLPNGSYSSGEAAAADVLGYKVTDIPYELRPYSGFVTEAVMVHTNPSGGTWTVFSTVDIRGNEPGYQGGSAGSGTIGNFDDLGDTPESKAGSPNKIVGVDLGEANLVYKDVTIDGNGTVNIPIGQEYQIDGNNLKLTDLDSTGFTLEQDQIVDLPDSLLSKENAFAKNTAFNKNFGTIVGTVLQGRTFGTAANNNTGDFEVPLTFSTGLTRTVNTITLDNTGDWTGTFDGQEGTYYLDYDNFTNIPSPYKLVYPSNSVLDLNTLNENQTFSARAFNSGSSNAFPTPDNGNAVLTINTFSGSFYHQLGFNNGGSVFTRFNGGTWREFWHEGNANNGLFDWNSAQISIVGTAVIDGARNIINAGTGTFAGLLTADGGAFTDDVYINPTSTAVLYLDPQGTDLASAFVGRQNSSNTYLIGSHNSAFGGTDGSLIHYQYGANPIRFYTDGNLAFTLDGSQDAIVSNKLTVGESVSAKSYSSTVQSLSGTTPTLDVSDGGRAIWPLTANSTLTLSNLVEGTTYSVTMLGAYQITMAGGYDFRVSRGLVITGDTFSTFGTLSKIVFDYDGTYVTVSGQVDYQ